MSGTGLVVVAVLAVPAAAQEPAPPAAPETVAAEQTVVAPEPVRAYPDLPWAARIEVPPFVLQSNEDDWFEVYGFAQVDYIQDFGRVNPAWNATLRPSRIPTVDGQFGDDGQAIISARQSRLGVQGNLPVGEDDLYTRFEFDLFGVGVDEGQTTIRLRHAFGSWQQFLGGQTNSLFMDGDVFPNVIDYWGPSGMVFLRSPQIRWTPGADEGNLAFALEYAGGDIDIGGADQIDPNLVNAKADNKLPDVTAQWRMPRDWGHFQVAGIARYIGFETVPGALPGTNEPSGGEAGYGLALTGSIKTGEKDKVLLSALAGKGIASYMNDGGVDLAADGTLTDPSAKTVPLIGLHAYYDHWWNERFSSSIGYSQTQVDNQALQLGNAFHLGQYASANLLYYPADNVLMGVELLWGRREDNDGADGDDLRLQFTLKYNFSSKNHARG
ncbi:MAG TPA: DcaP family trimeric outer membrane transporter [Planctomycetota bacterium]|nr:DcaP family trimeric outer membrane transporter [Planctomycetota bacterium]